MKNVFNVVKKELDKIFRNPRMIFSTFILSPLLIFIIYSSMGNIMDGKANELTKKTSNVIVMNVVEMSSENEEETKNQYFYKSLLSFNISYAEQNQVKLDNPYTLEFINIDFTFKNNITNEEYLDKESSIYKEINESLKNETVDAYLFYDQFFEDVIVKKEIPYMGINYRSASSLSTVAYQKINGFIEIQKMLIESDLYGQIINVVNLNNFDVSTSEEISNRSAAMLVPMMIVIFLFAGGMALGADLIAGEKERGTISTLLMAPINKTEIVIGKILSGIIIASISALCSAIGLLLSVGNLMGPEVSVSISFSQIIMLILVIVLLAFFAISLFMMLSTLASNIKEASAYIMPLYIIGMIVGILPMFTDHIPSNLAVYMIPIYNVVLAIKGILINELVVSQFLVISISTILYFIITVYITTKLFSSEKVMFNK